MIETQEFRGTRAWHAVAREKAIAEMEYHLGALMDSSLLISQAPMLVDAVLGAAMPYLEAGWRDAVLRFMALHRGDDSVLAPLTWPAGSGPSWYEVARFLWRQVPPEEVERMREGAEDQGTTAK